MVRVVTLAERGQVVDRDADGRALDLAQDRPLAE